MATEHGRSSPGAFDRVAILGAGAMTEMTFYIGPFIVGALVEVLGLSAGRAGMVFTLELFALASAALAVAGLIGRLPIRQTALVAWLLLMGGELVSLTASTPLMVIGARLAAGLGAGTLLAIANAMAARTSAPQRMFANLQLAVGIGTSTAFLALPLVATHTGITAIYWVRFTIVLVLGATLIGLPRAVEADRGASAARPALRWPVVATLLAAGLMSLSQTGLWAYVERIGVAIPLSVQQVSHAMVATGLLALAGPWLAALLGTRAGLLTPTLAGIGVQVLGALILGYALHLASYAFGAILFSAALIFTLPYLKAILTAVEPSGRAVSAMVAFVSIGGAIGPGALGLALEAGASYLTLTWLSTAGLIGVAVLVMPALRAR